MKSCVVVESMFGNTEMLANAVARGLGDAEVLQASTVDADLLTDMDLVVLGGPTHAFSMSRVATRREAIQQGGTQGDDQRGLRELIAELPAQMTTPVATFDSRVSKARKLPGSAAKSAGHALRRRHHANVVAEESFYVEDTPGPLLDGELARAEAWGQQLVSRLSD